MNLISISTDRKLFDAHSAVADRVREYGSLVGQQHIIVFTRGSTLKSFRLSENTWVYPTNSRSRFFYIRDARRIGMSIVRSNHFSATDTILSVQDPFETGLVGAFLKKKFGLKLQVQIHTDFLSPYFSSASFLNRLRVWISGRVLPKADTVRVVSQRIKNSLLKKFPSIHPNVVTILPIYIDTRRINEAPRFNLHTKYPQFSAIILICSRLAPEKNTPFALHVFKKILRDFSQIGLVIVGEGPEKKHLLNLVAGLGIGKQVVFEPWTNDVVSYYKTADIFLSTSLYEGYGLALIEAGMAGAAVVTSDVGIAGDLLVDGKSARVCAVNDEKAFISALKDLLASSDARHELGQQAKASLSTASLSKEQYLQHYKKLLELTFQTNVF